MKKIILIASLAASLATAATAHATQFVTNGNFATTNGPGLIGNLSNPTNNPAIPVATTSAPGWTTSGYNIVFANATNAVSSVALWDSGNSPGFNSWNGTAPGGVNFVAMDGDLYPYTQPVMQTITGLTAGKIYTLSFEYAFAQQTNYGGVTLQNISASFGGANVFTSPTYTLPSAGFSGWSTETLNVTATSSSEVLSFLAYGNLPVPPFALLTGVSLTGAVPEPATWGMMIVGLGAMGVAARRRRRQVVATA